MSNSDPTITSTSSNNKNDIEDAANADTVARDEIMASDAAGDVLYAVEDAATIKEPAKKRPGKGKSEPERLFTVEDAATIADEIAGRDLYGARGMLQRLIVREGETTLVRFFTTQLITLNVHFSIPDDSGGQITLRCNGKICALCKARFTATLYSLLPVFSIDEQAIRVMQFGRKAGPGSLCVQVLPLLKRENFTGYVYQVEKTRKLFLVKVFAQVGDDDLEDRDFGDSVLRSLVESDQMPTAEDVVGTIESLSNEEITDSYERVARRLRQFGERK